MNMTLYLSYFCHCAVHYLQLLATIFTILIAYTLYTVHCTLYSDFGLSKKHMINYCIPVLKVGYTTLRTTFVVYRRI